MKEPDVTTVAILGGLTAADDFAHAVDSSASFTESSLFHFTGHDKSGRAVGGLIRVANKPNVGHAECTLIVWLPDGTALFDFERPQIRGNTHWRVSAWNHEVLQAGGALFRTRYSGSALALSDPRDMMNPKRAFQGVRVPVNLDLHHQGKSPVSEFTYNHSINRSEEVARYTTCGLHQMTRCYGTLDVQGERSFTIEGFGWRDHNWGPRSWQRVTDHIMLTANFSELEGVALYWTADRQGYGFHRGGETLLQITELKIHADMAPDGLEPLSLRAHFVLANGEHHDLTGTRQGYMPLRNRRGNQVTHIGYSLWEYLLDGQHPGLGLGEFLIQR